MAGGAAAADVAALRILPGHAPVVVMSRLPRNTPFKRSRDPAPIISRLPDPGKGATCP